MHPEQPAQTEAVATPPPPPAADAPVAEHDKYWFDHVYVGDRQRQLTVRAVLTGCVIGGVMSISNLYVGLKIGWGLGVAITAAVLAFTLFTVLEKALNGLFGAGTVGHFTLLENNTMQTAASAAGYMSSAGLVSAIPALWMVSQFKLTVWQTIVWVTAISLLGIVAAIPVKRKLINQERLRFPSGIAAAETLRSLHATGSEGAVKGMALGAGGLAGGFVALLREGMHVLPDKLPLFGKGLALRSVAFEPSLVMIGAGAIMGFKAAFWMAVSGLMSRWFLADWLLEKGYITCGKLKAGEVCGPDTLQYGPINAWTLWPGVSLMVVHALVGLAIQAPGMIAGFKKTLAKTGDTNTDPRLAGVEVPFSWFLGGLVGVGALCVALQAMWFGIPPHWGLVAVLLSLLLAFVAARSVGETDINPVGNMGKVTQLVFGGLMQGQVNANLLAANVTAGAASHAGDLLTDMKAGYLVGARPRYQVISQVFGVLIGAVFASVAYQFLVDPTTLGGEKWPAPAAMVWAKVAELLSKGVGNMEPHKLAAIQIAAAVGAGMAILEHLTPPHIRKWYPSVAGVGIAMTVSFTSSFSMCLGACLAWLLGRMAPQWSERFTVVVASGLIAGETLMAVGVIAYGVLSGGV